MSISQRLEIKQSQNLVMTPQLQQAIKLLQMSNQELGEFVTKEIEQNPLLESSDHNNYSESETMNEKIVTEPEQISSSSQSQSPQPLSGKETDIERGNNEDVWIQDGIATDERMGAASRNHSFDEDEFSAAQNIAEKPSLRDHLLSQIHVDIADPGDKLVAGALIELLDEAGYLPADLDLVRTQLGATIQQFEHVIKQMQCFDPPGIFARSLEECLALQLREQNRLDPAMQILLKHLDLVAKRERTALMKLCGVDAEDLNGMIDEIKRLNPKPAQSFTSDVAPPIIPDVILKQLPGGGWHIELNTDTLPRVLANERYYAQVQSSARTKTDKDYLSERWQQANWLVKALNQRANTILKVATEIVRQQDNFFVHGVQHLKPLILRDIAAVVEMHESTVSRVTQHKYIATPRGLFELKYFFTTALARSDSDVTVSSEAVRSQIRALIEAETADEILSDDRITEILRKEGIDIARRTVAKYREAMHIASSAQRRRRFLG